MWSFVTVFFDLASCFQGSHFAYPLVFGQTWGSHFLAVLSSAAVHIREQADLRDTAGSVPGPRNKVRRSLFAFSL